MFRKGKEEITKTANSANCAPWGVEPVSPGGTFQEAKKATRNVHCPRA